MGSLQAAEIRAFAPSLEVGLHYHLTSNHFPPVDDSFIPSAVKAIELVNKAIQEGPASLLDEKIDLPNGVSLSAEAVVNGLHLHSWIETEEDGDPFLYEEE